MSPNYQDVVPFLVEQSADGMIFADVDGVIRVWNAAATTIFGYSSEEAVGKSLDLIIPERFREAHWTGFRRAMATGSTVYAGRALPTRSARKDGATIYVELTFALIRPPGGDIIGALANVRDITERFLRERQSRQG